MYVYKYIYLNIYIYVYTGGCRVQGFVCFCIVPWRKAGPPKPSRSLSGFGPVGCQERTLSVAADAMPPGFNGRLIDESRISRLDSKK